ncbi:MAG: T9SS type A sorting domain-containing protein [Bacteroidales bacterium]|nr:T9SS type A sorting domain-containing protein [Bacteroidales bacterium]MDD3812068.1 T9SS type A sorting domain-containing protein [Bacteroidales bacterium]MDD3871488.1 T9SS type A sorting domain-containing protein [Bacteroidales bacterium]NLO68116.1 T9SS type A sorting domain-containing protein [Bacteroidales bacterium]
MKRTLRVLTMMLAFAGMVTAGFSQAMPNAITIEPEDATAFDMITLTFDANLACTPDGKGNLLGLTEVAMHGAIKVLGSDWNSWGINTVDYNGTPGGGFTTRLTAIGGDRYQMSFVPADYFGVTADDGTFIGISCVFNNGAGWDSEGKDFGDGQCTDFQIPLKYVSGEPVVNFNLNLKKVMDAGEFIPGLDKAYVVIDGLGSFDMIDLDENFDSDSIYFVKVEQGLTKDETYEYHYRINDDLNEEVTREFFAMGGSQTLSDWWNDDPIVYPASVEIYLDMTYPIENELFNPESDYVDVAGSFNDWAPEEGVYHLEVTEDPNVYMIQLDLLGGESYDFKFRINSDWENSEFPNGGPNRVLIPKEGDQVVNLAYNTMVEFTVDMTKAVDAGQFDAESDYIDFAGTPTDWGGSDHLTLVDGNVYKILVSNVKPGEVLEYKFRINGNWETGEYPGGGPNRTYEVEYGYQVVHHFYDVPAGVQIDPLAQVSFYPNPASDKIMVTNAGSVERIVITNMLGQNLKTVPVTSTQMELQTGQLQKGIYFINFISRDGSQRTEKLLVR